MTEITVSQKVIFHNPSQSTKIALFDIGATSLTKILDASHYAFGLQFTPDGKSLAYSIGESGAVNLWVQPLDDSAWHAITDFKSETLW